MFQWKLGDLSVRSSMCIRMLGHMVGEGFEMEWSQFLQVGGNRVDLVAVGEGLE